MGILLAEDIFTQCISCCLIAGVYGGINLHGKPRKVSWSRLARTATAGSRQITLETAVDWVPGDQIVITTTTISAWQTEVMQIRVVTGNNRTLILTSNLQYQHKG